MIRMMAGTRWLAFSLFGLVAAALFTPKDAAANIYAFKDENGVTHFSNLPHLDKRYRLVYRIPTSAQMRPNAWSANGPKVVDIEKLVPIIANADQYRAADCKTTVPPTCIASGT